MKRILITRPRLQADSLVQGLRTAGFEPIFFPVIEIQPMEDYSQLDLALQNLEKYAWLVFTSVNGVKAVLDRFPLASRSSELTAPRYAAIGPKTAAALREHGVPPAFVPDEYVAEAILPGLGDLYGKWILLPRAGIARKALPEAIASAGGIAHEIAVYQTVPAAPDLEALDALRSGIDVVTFTSPSTVENFVAILEQNGLDPLHLPGSPRFACIGPITEQAARDLGLTGLIVAPEYTSEGLITLISGLGN